MSQGIDVQELALVLSAQRHNPAILSPEFLKCSGIIPADWELARPPINNPQVSQVLFRNGVGITAQADRVLFVEPIGAKAPQDVEVARIAQQYIQALPRAEYQALGINVRGFVPFAQDAQAAHRYMANTLLAPGAWQDFGQQPVTAALNLVYTLNGRQLFLSVNEAALQLPDEGITPIVLFSGNFEYRLTDASENVLPYLQGCLNRWQIDLETFKDLVNTRFLSQAPSAFFSSGSLSSAFSEPERLAVEA